MQKMLWFVSLMLLMCVGVFGLSSAPAQAQSVDLKIRLTGPAIGQIVPEGSSEYRESGARRSFRVEVNKVNVADGTTMTAQVNGVSVGVLILSGGTGRLALETERGQMVPFIKAGDVVTVLDPNGKIALSGTF